MTVTINGTTGVTTPEVILDNSTADGGQVVLKSSGYSNWNLDNYNGNFRAYYDSTEFMRVESSGNFKFNSGYGSAATAYGCRAWVNFNGTGTVAIRASGNVSSITDNGTGDYTVNFTTAMPDANYSIGGVLSWTNGVSASGAVSIRTDVGTPATTNCRLNCVGQNGTQYDRDYVLANFFR